MSQHLEKWPTLQQKYMTVKDYAAKFCMLLQHIPQDFWPADEILNDCFLRGLGKDLRTNWLQWRKQPPP